MLSIQYPVLFFDGDCLLCSRVVQWIIKVDRKGLIYFCTLEDGRKAGIDGLENDTVVLWHQHQMYQKSKAVAEVLKLVGVFYRIIGYIISFFPRFIADKIYDFVAKNRYHWFGQKADCLIPKPEWSYRIFNGGRVEIETGANAAKEVIGAATVVSRGAAIANEFKAHGKGNGGHDRKRNACELDEQRPSQCTGSYRGYWKPAGSRKRAGSESAQGGNTSDGIPLAGGAG